MADDFSKSKCESDALTQASAGAGNDRLEGLRSANRIEQGRAIQSLYQRINERAERMALKMMGEKSLRVDLQPESVVLSVMARELPKLAVVCNDDQHLEARLLRAIRNRFIDRLRARKDVNPDSRGDDGESENFDAMGTGEGPQSVVIAFEQSIHEREALLKLVSRLTATCKSDDERTMVEQFLVKNQSWSAIAKQLGKNENAAKVAFSRLRQRLLESVLAPLRLAISGPEWAVVHHLCLERKSVEESAAAVGVDRAHVLTVFQTRILPALRAEYGAAGIESLVRLIGKVRSEDPTGHSGKRP
jgi:DNA-directed RNA polymerase specialized sigma24 family protein